MKWAHGKDKFGRVQTCSDGHPAFLASECRQYTISRAMTPSGFRYDAWRRRFNERGAWDIPIQLAGGLASSQEAIKTCEAHHGRNP